MHSVYAMMLIFQKNSGRPGGGGSGNSDTCGQGGRGVKMGKNSRKSFMEGKVCRLMYRFDPIFRRKATRLGKRDYFETSNTCSGY